MTPRQLERYLLLEQSGELSERQRRILDTELARSPAARDLRHELCGLAAALPEPITAPAPDAAANIAARLVQTAAPAPHFRPLTKTILAAAAALALFVSVQSFRAYRLPGPATTQLARSDADATADREWTDPLEDEFAELENVLFAISENLFEFAEL